MDVINFFVRLLRDPRTAIAGWITTLGLGPTYAIIFLIIFIETGVVFMPFLPGDSLLFAAGYFAADPKYPITLPVLLPILLAAPIMGDQCN
ncbi:MAG: DedA family protein, partial [Scardovia wiggsiae]|nr:DedA family protein [Scardovia wiggsiae]